MSKKLSLIFLVVMILANVKLTVLASTLNEGNNSDQVWSLDNRSTRLNSEYKEISVTSIPDHYKMISENNNLKLYLDEETLGLKIENKKTGYVWDSVWMEEEESINQTWSAFAQSALTLEVMNEKGKVEKVSFPTKKSNLKLKTNNEGFVAEIDFKDIGIELQLIVTLEAEGIKVEIPSSSIKETKDKVKLQSIYVYPFLGATKGQAVPGYLFVPDGSGALIQLDHQNTVATEPFIKRIYGSDLGMSGVKDNQDMTNEPEIISYPVYGVVHNADVNGVVAIIEKGAEYGEINAYPAGITTPFNWVTSRFIIRESYFQPSNKKGEGFTVNQAKANQFDIAVHFSLLSDQEANYVGMAKKYRDYLVDQGVLKAQEVSNENIPMRLEFLASDTKKALFGEKTVTMTSVEEMEAILNDLNQNDINHLKVVVRGWNKGGSSTGTLNHFPFEKTVGSADEWLDIINNESYADLEVFFYTDYIKGYKGTKGYSVLKDAAQMISEQLLSSKDSIKEFNYLSPLSTEKFMMNDKKAFDKYQINRLAMDTLGSKLYSNAASLTANTRSESIEIYNRSLGNMEMDLALYQPNDYLWKNTTEYFDIPMGSSNYLSTTDTVPFLQIVLKGYLNFYATSFNFASNPDEFMLKLIDYGAYPSFYLTEEDSVKLLKTGSEWLYTSKYDILKEQILDVYQTLNETLKLVEGEVIESRRVLAEDIIEVTYSNGISFIVNYTDHAYQQDGKNVVAKSFEVIGGNRHEVKGEN